MDSLVFLGGYDHTRVTVFPTNEYRFVLDCIEESAEAPSGGGHSYRFHIHLIDKTEQTQQRWRGCRALPGWTYEGVRPHMVRGVAGGAFQLHCFSCYTVFVSSKSQLRNVTVTLEEDVAQWARIEAARRDTSVSRLLGELLKERMTAQDGYERAMRRALGRKPFVQSTSSYLRREEAHDRSRLR